MISPLGFKLKAGRTVHITVDYWDLEELIKKVYGISQARGDWSNVFRIVAMEEWGNDQSHEFTVKKEPLGEWDVTDLDEFMQNPFTANYKLYVLLQDMCNQGHIEEGEYLVRVSW